MGTGRCGWRERLGGIDFEGDDGVLVDLGGAVDGRDVEADTRGLVRATEVWSFHDNTSSSVDVTLLGNRPGGEHVVSCTYCRMDAGPFTSGYSLSDTSRRGSLMPVMPA